MLTKLVDLRKERNMSQQDVAEAVGVSQGQIGHYEKGRSMPSVEVLVRLARLFGVTTDELLTETEVEPEPI